MANDIVQETFTRLWEKVRTVNYEKVRSYLFTSAYRIFLNHIRDGKRIEQMDDVKTNDYGHNEQYTDLKEVLNLALDQLPEIQKTVILLRDYEGYNYQEIAGITNLNESQVKVYIYRGRMALKEKIGKLLPLKNKFPSS